MNRRRGTAFTLLEILIVMVIMTLALGLVLPRIGRLPAGLVFKQGVGEVRRAFRDASNRARATGATLRLTLNSDSNTLTLSEAAPPAMKLPPPTSATPNTTTPGAAPVAKHFSGSMQYELPKGFEWALTAEQRQGTTCFEFFPNGEATGPTVELSTGKHKLQLDVDRLTGRPIVIEEND